MCRRVQVSRRVHNAIVIVYTTPFIVLICFNNRQHNLLQTRALFEWVERRQLFSLLSLLFIRRLLIRRFIKNVMNIDRSIHLIRCAATQTDTNTQSTTILRYALLFISPHPFLFDFYFTTKYSNPFRFVSFHSVVVRCCWFPQLLLRWFCFFAKTSSAAAAAFSSGKW